MNTFTKKLLGVVGLLAVIALTVFASTIPQRGAHAVGSDIVVSVEVEDHGVVEPPEEVEPPVTPEIPETGYVTIGDVSVAKKDLIITGVITLVVLVAVYYLLRARRRTRRR